MNLVAKPNLKLFIDTDIGGEVEDAIVLTLVVASEKVEIVGVTIVTGDTNFRAYVAKKLLSLLGKIEIPVIPEIGNSKTIGGWGYNAFLDKDEKINIGSKVIASDFILNQQLESTCQVNLPG